MKALIGKIITTTDYKGQKVTRRVLGIDNRPTISLTQKLADGEYFVLAGPKDTFDNRTYALTNQPYEVK